MRFTKHFLFIVCLTGLTEVATSKVYYADASASGNGSGSQSSPYDNFHDAYQNASSGDTLDLSGTFDWSSQTTNISSPDGYTIGKDLTIRGQGAGKTIVQAGGKPAHFSGGNATHNRRVFTIKSGNTITIKKLTIRYGNSGSNGAGINSSGTLTLDQVSMAFNSGKNSTVRGGAIYNQGNALTVKNSTLKDNYAYYAGAILFHNTTSEKAKPLKITNSTVAKNETKTYGAVTVQGGPGHNAYITKCTIADNNNSFGATAGTGVGFYHDGGKTVYLKNSIISKNKDRGGSLSGKTVDIGIGNNTGSLQDNGGNIYGKYDPSQFTLASSTWYDQQVSGSPDGTYQKKGNSNTGTLDLSGTLKSNNTNRGTKTLRLTKSGSIAVDNAQTGANQGIVNIPTKDQRGATRKNSTDIGSYEWNGPNGALPVEMFYFRARSEDGSAILTWLTASETNNSHFIVQKRVNDDWLSIGRVKGRGTTTEKHRYSFVDPEFSKGQTHYYRLKQVDYDGSHEYSHIRTVKANETSSDSVSIYPNPVSQELNFKVNTDQRTKTKVIIRDIYGQEVYRDQKKLTKRENANAITVDHMNNGHYILILLSEQVKVHKRFIKVD